MTKPKRESGGYRKSYDLWGALWVSTPKRDPSRHLLGSWRKTGQPGPVLFRTRQEAREWIEAEYGYIRERRYLRAEPHCWHIPRAVRVRMTVETITRQRAAGGKK